MKTAKKSKLGNPPKSRSTAESADAPSPLPRMHLLIGWWSLLVFLVLGILLETLHGFKVGWYLDVSQETRRLMWTLAHTHGTLLSLVHMAFGVTLSLVPDWPSRSRTPASYCLTAAGIVIPAGFFLGGAFIYDGDPGLGILLVPPGALLLLVAVLLTARGIRCAGAGGDIASCSTRS